MSPYLEHVESSGIKIDLSLLFVQDHELNELRDEALLAESLVQDRHRLRHVSLRVPLALVHRVLDHLRPLVVPVEALVQEDRLFPFLLRGGWLVAVESDPEIVIAIARLDVVDLHGTLEDVSERSLEVDARWLLQPTEGGDTFLGNLDRPRCARDSVSGEKRTFRNSTLSWTRKSTQVRMHDEGMGMRFCSSSQINDMVVSCCRQVLEGE